MKRLFLVVGFVLTGGVVAAFAEDPAPRVMFETTAVDFGKVTEGDILKHIFKFSNQGASPLDIKLEPSCGCTTAVASATHLEPGQSAQIEITVNTDGVAALSETVALTTTDPQNPKVNLTVKGMLQHEFVLSESVVNLGSGPRGAQLTKEVFITVATDKQVRVLAAESTDAHVKVRLEPVAGDAGKVKLTATQKADAPEGYHHGSIVIKTTSASKPELKLIVWGTVEERPADSTDVEN